MNLAVNWLISAFAIMLTGYLLPGVTISGFRAALLAALVFGLINAFIRPILSLLTLPLTILTLGLFSLALNGLLVMLVTKIVPGFQVQGFLWGVAFSLLLSLINPVLALLKQ